MLLSYFIIGIIISKSRRRKPQRCTFDLYQLKRGFLFICEMLQCVHQLVTYFVCMLLGGERDVYREFSRSIFGALRAARVNGNSKVKDCAATQKGL